MREYTALFPFCGLGSGAMGKLEASVELLGVEMRFRCVGGIDIDPLSCEDFRKLTGAPALQADVLDLTPAELRAFAGDTAPDLVFLSPPCKGASALLSTEQSRTPKYAAMNELALVWTRLMLATWKTPPRLVLVENVPRIKMRAAKMVRELRRLLREAGYVLHDGFHDCGELGGLAQTRKRWLLVARHASVPSLLYQPPVKRLRACGEVLETLPVPLDGAGGPLHALPKLSWRNWLRLALIPGGGDWRDLPGVLGDGQARRERFRRYHVERWGDPSVTIAASKGPNGAYGIADPRVRHWNGIYGVIGWDESSRTVTGNARHDTGAFSVADPRLGLGLADNPRRHHHKYRVRAWTEPAGTVTGATRPGSGSPNVADPRGVGNQQIAWTGEAWVSVDTEGRATPIDLDAKPAHPPVILSPDGCWHRPLTPLELAALQGLPTKLGQEWLTLAGSMTSVRERIGNAVPRPTAEAIARQMLLTLGQADAGAFTFSSGAVWVKPEELVLPC